MKRWLSVAWAIAVVATASPALAGARTSPARAAVARRSRSEAELHRISRQHQEEVTGGVGWRPHLTKVRYASGEELLHVAPDSRGGTSRAVNEVATARTARHLDIPLEVVPPVVASERTVFGRGSLMPFIKGLRKLAGSDMDPTLHDELTRASSSHPERIDWESVHAVLLLDFITGQKDRQAYNVFFHSVDGRLTAVAVDNESTFGNNWPPSSGLAPRDTMLAHFVRNGALRSEQARQLSPRLARGLAEIDVDAWVADLLDAGVAPHQVEMARGRLLDVQRRGLDAVVPELARMAPLHQAPGR